MILGGLALIVGLAASGASRAADLRSAEALYRGGQYEECAQVAEGEVRSSFSGEAWGLLKIRAELAQGDHEAARRSLEFGLDRVPSSLALRLLGIEVYRLNGRERDAERMVLEAEQLILRAPYRYTTPEGRVALGRFFLLKGVDARRVLDQCYDVAIQQRPDLVEAYLATAALALEKQDDALAAETLQKAPEAAAEDPAYHHLLARAFSSGDRERSTAALDRALEINPRHADSLLLQVDLLIDGERYDEAAEVLDRVQAVNPREARAWAYRAVLAHLRNDLDGEAAARRSALESWATNPEVDHVIGRKLSQKYRFAEGSTYQQAALAFDPAYLPAKVQLCQDYLRLGREQEGWALADQIFADDAYNVVAYNLVTLRDHLDGFETLWGDGVLVRMDPREAQLYGPRVVALLEEAKATLCAKYEVEVEGPILIEIFPQRRDFAVRTFGLPGAAGLLGVCFGDVITAISPAAQGSSPSSWEAVLWHELCHAITLSKSRNKMPRWLSEGISVYEESQRDPAWGTAMNPRFRERILGDDLTPLSELSSAFLTPETPLDLQFAYFESALAVEFLVETSGPAALNGLLDDLGAGKTINESLPGRTGMTLEQLDEEFESFARGRARSVAPDATWEQPDLAGGAADLPRWVESHPNNFPGLQLLARQLIAAEQWGEAREILERLKTLYPEYVGADNAYMLLATVHRNLDDPAAERAALAELAARHADAGEALARLTELDEASGRWDDLAANARRLLGLNPLVPTPHRRLARAAEEMGERREAIAANRALTLLDEPDPAGLHHRLARLLREDGQADEARREVLKALEEAPRFLDAHRLLLDIVEPTDTPPAGAISTAPVSEGETP